MMKTSKAKKNTIDDNRKAAESFQRQAPQQGKSRPPRGLRVIREVFSFIKVIHIFQ